MMKCGIRSPEKTGFFKNPNKALIFIHFSTIFAFVLRILSNMHVPVLLFLVTFPASMYIYLIVHVNCCFIDALKFMVCSECIFILYNEYIIKF